MKKKISFLDLKVNFNEGKISTYLHTKFTERHQYLHSTSSHPNHSKRSTVCSQGLRVKKINSEKEVFEGHERDESYVCLKGLS